MKSGTYDAERVDAIFEKKFSLMAMAKARGRKRIPKPPRPTSNKPLQLAYLKDLRTMLKYLFALTKEIVIPRVSDILATAQNMRPDRKDDYSDDIDALKETLKRAFYRTYTDDKIAEMALNAASRTEAKNAKYLQSLSMKIAGVNIAQAEPWMRPVMRGFVKENVGLIKKTADAQIDRIEGIVMRGVQQGWRHEEIAQELIDSESVAENRAALIARDQTNKFSAELTENRFKEAGIEEYTWMTAGDNRVRDEHAEMEGHTFNWTDDEATDGSGVSKPDGFNPGEDFNCRCQAIPVMSSAGIEGVE
jgi:SPP1 gp7 family putative phage head morphogenesis protein